MSTITLRRIVTDVDAHGTSVFVDDEPIASTESPELDIYNLWGTNDVPVVGAGSGSPAMVSEPFYPGPGGVRAVQCVLHPGIADASASEGQEGLQDAFDQERPGFHTTDTVDYGICLDGEVYLVLDHDEERLITPGTVVVQHGTTHAWQNRSDRDCTMLFVIHGAERS
ncbi:cupin domain-containing protein [Microbacterium sp. BWT-B31]|uniref:cupin domain-containing protein n=1 Tax=Microbacterium sp. BWT-B31 TaxID=3232072 RepID=UPI003528CAED